MSCDFSHYSDRSEANRHLVFRGFNGYIAIWNLPEIERVLAELSVSP